jgi:hypothetical protein
MCCSRHARTQVRALAATKPGVPGPFSEPTVATPLSSNHPLPQPLAQDEKPAPAAGSDLNPLLQSALQPFKKLAVANGRCAERQWRLVGQVADVRNDDWSPTGDVPKGN